MRLFTRTLCAQTVLAVSLALGACSSADISFDRNAAIVIPAGSSYSWGTLPEEKTTADNADIDNDIVRRRIQSAINAALQEKGLRQAEAGPGRFEVSYHIGVARRTGTEVNYVATPMAAPVVRCGLRTCWGGMSWGYMGPPVETVNEYDYREGSLIIDIVEHDSGRLAWRGIYRNNLRDKPDLGDEKIRDIVNRTLKGLVL